MTGYSERSHYQHRIPGPSDTPQWQTAARRKAVKLVQVFTEETGHRNFTAQQWADIIDAMNSWLDTGAKPDASFSDVPGFYNDLVPRPCPQPVNCQTHCQQL